MRVQRRVAERPLRDLVDVKAVFDHTARLHTEDREIGTVDETLRSEILEDLPDHVLVRVGREIPDRLLRILKILKPLSHVFIGICAPEVGYKKLKIRIILFDLAQLAVIDRIRKTLRPRNMELHDPFMLICERQVLLRQEIVNADLRVRDILRRVLEIDLKALEDRVGQDALFDLLRALGRMRHIKRRIAHLLRALRDIGIRLRQVDRNMGVRIESGNNGLAREKLLIGLDQVLDRVVLRHHHRPGAAAVLRVTVDAELVLPDVRVAVDKPVRQEILQFFLIEPGIVGSYIKQCHSLVLLSFCLHGSRAAFCVICELKMISAIWK